MMAHMFLQRIQAIDQTKTVLRPVEYTAEFRVGLDCLLLQVTLHVRACCVHSWHCTYIYGLIVT